MCPARASIPGRMLEGLGDVNWSSLEHAYGPATDVPDNLKALVSGNARAARAALQELGGSLLHRGSIYEATTAVVPFLAEIALEPFLSYRVRVHVLVMLAEASNPYFPGDVERECRDAVARTLTRIETLLEERSAVGLAAAEVLGMVPASMNPAPEPLRRLRDDAKDAAVQLALDIVIARIEGADANPFVERLTEVDLLFREHRAAWEDASLDRLERSAIDIVMERAISKELRRKRG